MLEKKMPNEQPPKEPDTEIEVNGEITNLHKELKQGVQLTKPPEKDMRIRQIDHDNRMREFKDLKEKIDGLQDIIKEITTGVTLQKVPESEKKAIEAGKQARLQQISVYKKNIDSTIDLINVLKGEFEKGELKESLEKVSPEELQTYKLEKQKRVETLINANKQLLKFSNVLEEVTKQPPQLVKPDADEIEARTEEKQLRMRSLQDANKFLIAFGETLELINKGTLLDKPNESDLKQIQDERAVRLKEAEQVKARMDVVNDLVDSIMYDLKIRPFAYEDLKDQIMSRYEVAYGYLQKVQKEKADKVAAMVKIGDKINGIGALLAEVKNAQLKPRDPAAMAAYEKDKAARLEAVAKIRSTFDITNELLEEIQAPHELTKVPKAEIDAVIKGREERGVEIKEMRNHMAVLDSLMDTMKKGIVLQKPDPAILKSQHEAQQKRLEEIQGLKNKLDIVAALSERMSKGAKLQKVNPKDLEAIEADRKKRLKEITALKEKLKQLNIEGSTEL